MKAMITSLLLTLCTSGFAQPEIWGGDISVELVGDVFSSLTIRASVNLFFNGVEPADVPAEIELCWGDGICSPVPLEFAYQLESNTALGVYITNHTYPSRGTYVLTIEECCYSREVLNFQSQEDIPIRIHNTYTLLDPQFQGSNSSAVMLQPAIDIGRTGTAFNYNPNLYDSEGDSLTYSLVEPTDATAYLFPQEFDNCTNNLRIDAVTGDFSWEAPCLPGRYVFGIQAKEWRGQAVIGEKLILLQVLVETTSGLLPDIDPALFRASPNPTSGMLRLDGTAGVPVHFALRNSNGQVLREWRTVQLPSQVSLAGLPRGIYFLQGITGNRIFARKIIKH